MKKLLLAFLALVTTSLVSARAQDDGALPFAVSIGAQPAIIILQNTTKGTLVGTMEKKKIAPGSYLVSVVAEGKTASILFKIE